VFGLLKEKYLGEWEEGLLDGQGMYMYNDGSVYQGRFKNDKKEGNGVIVDNKRN
jgi:hypothetical protein